MPRLVGHVFAEPATARQLDRRRPPAPLPLVAALGALALLFGGCGAAGAGSSGGGSGSADGALPGHGDGVSLGSAAIKAWVTEVTEYLPGEEANAYTDPSAAVGAASGISTDTLVLGRGGTVTVAFGGSFGDGPGAEVALFENGIGDRDALFAELAYVEVASDGSNFVRFPVYTGRRKSVASYEQIDPQRYGGFAGLHPAGTGTAFDLSELADSDAVRSGDVDLAAITHIRLVDVIGDGRETDEDGNPIYDPYPTTATAGFDLDGVALLDGG